MGKLLWKSFWHSLVKLLLFSLLLPKYLWNEYTHLTILDFFVHPPHFAIFLSMYFVLSKCFYSHLPNKWACQKPIQSCLLNYFSIYVSVYFYMCLLCLFIGVRLLGTWDYPRCLNNRYTYLFITQVRIIRNI